MSECSWEIIVDDKLPEMVLLECSVCKRKAGVTKADFQRLYGGELANMLKVKQPPCEGPAAAKKNEELYTKEKRDCESEGESESVTWEKTKSWLAAVKKWTLAGFPVRSIEEVEDIYNNKCLVCEEISKKGSCKKCGCKVSKSKVALINKIRMKTESCPIEKW